MVRHISVYREHGEEPLYEEPFGSEEMVLIWWSEPAAFLGLPFIAAIYDRGFYHGTHWTGPELSQVLVELASLGAHWASAPLSPDIGVDLVTRANYLRVALDLAEACGGYVTIGKKSPLYLALVRNRSSCPERQKSDQRALGWRAAKDLRMLIRNDKSPLPG